MAKALRTDPASLARMRRNLALLDNPVEFARRYLRSRGFGHRHRDFDELLSIAVNALVKAGLSWGDRNGEGVAFTTWAYQYMDNNVLREIARDHRRLNDLGIEDCATTALNDRWLTFDAGTSWYERIEDRLVIHDLCDRANLSDRHRFILEFYAMHGGTNGPPPRGQQPVGNMAQTSDFQTAKRRIHKVLNGRWLDDEWARARARRAASQPAEGAA